MNDFDWKYYVNYYKDLRKAGINTKEKAYNHWIKYGKKEKRICKKEINTNLSNLNNITELMENG